MRRPGRLVTLALALPLVLGGCRLAAAEPSATPADFPGITRVLGPLGIAVDGIVSGDAGCPDPDLARTAISFQASGLDQPTPVALHLYRFNDDAAYQRNLGAVDTCASHYVADPARYVKIAASPYLVAASGPLGPAFLETLTRGLRTAAASGG